MAGEDWDPELEEAFQEAVGYVNKLEKARVERASLTHARL